MKKIIKYINSKVLVRVAWLNSATVITKIIAGFLTTKFIAIFIGAEGMALIGNLRSFFTAIQTTTTIGLYNGVVKYISEFKDNALKLSKIVSTTYYIGFVATILVSFLCYYNAETINNFLFLKTYNYIYVIKIMALAIPFYSLNMFCFSIMNGFSKYKILLVINIVGQLMGLGVTLLLIWKNNIDGALISVVISPSLMFLITLVGILNRRNLMSEIKVNHIDFKWLYRFAPFTLMAVVSGIVLPFITIAIRNYIIEAEGMKDAGLWEAMNRISNYYLMFLNSIMTLYFLPRFAEIDNKIDFRNEVFGFYKNIAPVFALGLLVIFLLKTFIINIFLTEEFVDVKQLFGWQLLGDFVKILSVLIAYHFVAKRMLWHFIITESFLVFITYFTSVYLIDKYGVIGANMGHFASYLMYFIIILMIFRSSLFGVVEENKE